MTRKDRLINHLLLCLMEECAEVAMEASKAQRFGLRNRHKSQASTPEKRLDFELNDLYVIVECLRGEGVKLDECPIKKLDKYRRLDCALEYSRKRGML